MPWRSSAAISSKSKELKRLHLFKRRGRMDQSTPRIHFVCMSIHFNSFQFISIHLCTWIMMYICLLDVLLLYGVFSVCFYLAGGKEKTSTAAVCRCNVTSTTSRMVHSSFQRLSSNNPYSFWSVNFFIIEEDTKPNCQRVSQRYQALAVDTVSQYKSHLCLNILTEKLIIHWTIVFFIYLYIIT